MRRVLPLLLAGLCVGGMLARAQENLVANPGFEAAPAKGGKPGGGWWLSQTVGESEVNLDHTVAHSGKSSARFTGQAPEKCVLVSQKFAVEPGDDVHFGVWVRGANLAAGRDRAYAGVVFRTADAKVLERRYAPSTALGGDWVNISGVGTAPAEAAYAEMHLGYTNGPGTLWYDDVTAVITNTMSLALIEEAKPWPGAQEIGVRVVNRQALDFRGSISVQIGKKESVVPVALKAKSSANFQVPITLNGVGQHAYKISLHDGTGNTLRFLQGKFKTSEPLVLFPPDPCYQIIGAGSGDTLISAVVNVDPARRAGMKLAVSVVDSGGKVVQTTSAPVSRVGTTDLHVLIPQTTASEYTIKAMVADSAGGEVAKAGSDVHVIAPEEAQVRLGPDGFLRVAGKPEFPIGLYNSSRDEELAKAGFNATHNYNISSGDAADPVNHTDPQLKEILDESWASGLRMMVELPRKAIEKGQWEQVTRRIETFRHHPGLLCWGSEERVARGLTTPAHIAALYALAHKLDPDHPLVLGDTRDVIEHLQVDRRDFFPDASMDVGIWWWYPIPMRTAKGNALEGAEASVDMMESPNWLTTTHSRKPLWIAIQAYQKPARDARFPTPAEYRCQAYLSIIYGVKGLFFYCGSGQKDYLGKPSGILNKPEEGHWEYVKQLAGELRDFSPVIMAPPASEKIELTSPNPAMEFTTRELAGKVYLIAASKAAHPQRARWQGELFRGKKAVTLFEDHPAQVVGDALADDFPAFGVHVYRLE